MAKIKRPFFEAGGKYRALNFKLSKERPEAKRVYTFPGGDVIELENVIEVEASRHGNHAVKTTDGMTHIVPSGWLCLTFPTEARVAPEQEK